MVWVLDFGLFGFWVVWVLGCLGVGLFEFKLWLEVGMKERVCSTTSEREKDKEFWDSGFWLRGGSS
jgi:hypothetical protein